MKTRFRGIYLERNDAAFEFFEAWMKYIKSLGFEYLTYHTIMDTYERLSIPDLKVDATIVAWLAACAANDPGRIPVYPVVEARPQMPF